MRSIHKNLSSSRAQLTAGWYFLCKSCVIDDFGLVGNGPRVFFRRARGRGDGIDRAGPHVQNGGSGDNGATLFADAYLRPVFQDFAKDASG